MESAVTVEAFTMEPVPDLVLVPFLTPGHIVPMTDLALLLAHHGAFISLVTTPLNASRFNNPGTIHPRIRVVQLNFPCAEAGLPDGCENLDLITSPQHYRCFFQATNMLRDPLTLHLRDQQPPPSCIVFDALNPWAGDIARDLGIPRMVFHGYSAFALLCLHNIRLHNLYELIADDAEPFLVPDLPHGTIETTKAKSPGLFSRPGWESLRQAAIEGEMTADGAIVNSFDALEPLYIEGYGKALGTKAWALGPFSLSNSRYTTEEHRCPCLRWLDSMELGSVIYVGFGSLAKGSVAQLMEIGAGLEASGQPFVWIIKNKEMRAEVEEWLSGEDGFEERVRSRGMVIRGWVPQVAILSHPAVGGFVTHCGWNSVLEAVCAGVPMLTWPHFAEQFLNEKLVVQVLQIGVAVGIKAPIYPVADENVVVVKRDEVSLGVRQLMERGQEWEERRRRIKELSGKAKRAILEPGGSSNVSVNLLFQHITQLRHQTFKGKLASSGLVNQYGSGKA